MRKKQLLFTLAAVTVLSLSGCHKDKPTPTETEPLATIAPDKVDETISDKLDDPASTTLEIETAPAPKAIGIDENGEKEYITMDSNNSKSDTESSFSGTVTDNESLNADESNTVSESLSAEEESKMAEENAKQLEAMQQSAEESIAASDETLSASDYQAMDDAIAEYNKKQAEEVFSNMPEYK